MIKKSKVKSIQSSGSWTGKEGKLFYKFEIEMENGDNGEYSSISKEQTKFVKGVEAEYNYTSGPNPKIKPHYEQKQSFANDGDRQILIVRQSSLKVACDLVIANGEINQLIPMAEKLTKWVMTGEK
tara:strand:- start:3926 stop:4303 length:378 start_codon:yes stop_codon:yes gene_type:complete